MKNKPMTPIQCAMYALASVGIESKNDAEIRILTIVCKCLEKIENEYEPQYEENLKNYFIEEFLNKKTNELKTVKFSIN